MIAKFYRNAALLAGLLSQVACAIPPDESAEHAVATEQSIRSIPRDGKEQSYLTWSSIIGDVFDIPISFEWSYVNEDRSDGAIPKMDFDIDPGQTLEQVLDNFCMATKGSLQWGRIAGIIWIWPTGSGGRVESLLEAPVSLRLNGASVWEALLELSRDINANATNGRYVKLSPQPSDESLPPLEFRNEGTVSVDLTEVSAREAVSMIMASSTLRMRARYTNFYRPNPSNPRPPSARIALWAFDENHRLLRHIPDRQSYREVEKQWRVEADSVVPQRDATGTLPPTQEP